MSENKRALCDVAVLLKDERSRIRMCGWQQLEF